MSSGLAPCCDWIMTIKKFKKLFPAQYDKLIINLRPNTIEDFCKAYEYDMSLTDLEIPENYDDSTQSYSNNIIDLWNDIVETIKTGTNGLTLSPLHHDSKNGDIYDDKEADGGFFSVSGVTQLTPAGEKYKNYIKFCQWTDYG